MHRFQIAPKLLILAIFISLISGRSLAEPPPSTQTDSKPDANSTEKTNPTTEAVKQVAAEKQGWKPLLGKWKPCQFGGDGEITITDKMIDVQVGDPISGVFWEGDVLRDNYELQIQAQRTDGFDFFCGLTFPIAKDHVTLVLGGWGGGITGISSIDGRDASENETTLFREYEGDQWYTVRTRVDPFGITCWVDDKVVAEVPREGHTFGLRFEMELCEPLGMAAYQCDAQYRGIKIRKLNADELKAAEAKKKQWAEDGAR